MRHIYFDKNEIPRVAGSHIDTSKGNVFIFMPEPGEKLTNKTKRVVIGRATSQTMMYPNDNFRTMYPNLWTKYYGESVSVKEYQLNAGMYELILGIGYQSNLYPLLIEAYGPQYANAIMDLAMYSNISKSDTMMLFKERMKEEIIFSKERFDDSWISDFLTNKMSYNQNMRFMDLWLDNCMQKGETDVWFSIDGTNDDCNVEDYSKAEKTKAKSRRASTDAITYMYVISAKTGLPLFMVVVNGGMVDAKTIKNATAHLANHNIRVKGVILDRVFCTIDVVKELEKLEYPYVLMLKSNTHSHTEMLEKYGDTIRWNLDYFVENANGTLFGCTSQNAEKIFGNNENKAFINLFFDGSNEAERISTLNLKIVSTKKRIVEMINNEEDITIPTSMTRYIGLKKEGDSIVPYYKIDNWKNDMGDKGFYSIATSENFGASLTNQYYDLRNCSKVMYAESKDQLGFNVLRAHSGNGVENKLFIGFIATIIRSYIMQACKELKMDTNKMVIEMDCIHVRLNNASGNYDPIHDESQRQTALLKYFSVDISDLDSISSEYNSRNNAITSQVRKLKSFEDSQKVEKSAKENEPTDDKVDDKKEIVQKKTGRPLGSKNKSTLEREAKIASGEIKPKEKGKPGRPKGSLNKKTLLKLKKRKLGRPAGSKNKKTLEREQQAKEQSLVQKDNLESSEIQTNVDNQVQPQLMVEGKSAEILKQNQQIIEPPKKELKNIQIPEIKANDGTFQKSKTDHPVESNNKKTLDQELQIKEQSLVQKENPESSEIQTNVDSQVEPQLMAEGKSAEILKQNQQITEPSKKDVKNIPVPEIITNDAKNKRPKAGRPLGSKDKQKSQKRKGRTFRSRNKTKIAEDQLLNEMIEKYSNN